MSARPNSPPALTVDVLIIGGGVMGLWLLNDLHKHGYSAALLEKGNLGGGQTCHSHVYLHRGHVYKDSSLVLRLRGVNAMWRQWIKAGKVPCQPTSSYFGFRDPSIADQKELLWRSLKLPVRSVRVPAVLQGGAISRCCKTFETCLSGEVLVQQLRSKVDSFITRIERLDAMVLDEHQNSLELIHAVDANGARLTVHPRALVATAGEGNQGVLNLIANSNRPWPDAGKDLQQVRRSFMLIVKGKKGDLEPLTGVFPDLDGLFVVSRERDDQVIWLVSDFRGPEVKSETDRKKYDVHWWVPKVVALLQELAPKYCSYANRVKLEWGVYEAPKAEGKAGGQLPHEWRITQVGLTNVWMVWPTKLTFAPKVSREVLRQIKTHVPKPTPWKKIPAAWNSSRESPRSARELWEETPVMCWTQFRDRYL